MTTMWVIESGSYSQYGVLAVCATEDEAKAVCDRGNALMGADPVYPWSYSRRAIVVVDDVTRLWTRTFEPDGSAAAWHAEYAHRFGDDEYATIGFAHNEGVSGEGETWFHVDARTPERAAKIAQDHVAQRKAEEAGLT